MNPEKENELYILFVLFFFFFFFFFVDKDLLKGYFFLGNILFSILFRLLVPTFATDTVLFDPLPYGLAGPPLQSILRM